MHTQCDCMIPLMADIVIPTRMGRAWLPGCLAALRAQTAPPGQIIVVDNASEDGSAEWLAAQPDPNLRVIRNAANAGFAAACNQGIRASDAAFVALLNDDTEPEPRWLEQLLAGAQSSSRVGSVACLMVFANNPEITQSAGIAIDRAAIAWDRLGGQPAASAPAQTACEVFGASGGAALYQREMLDQIGLFDERFFAYLEDVDLAWRAQRAGWRCVYQPGAVTKHFTSATSGEGSPFKQRLLGRNKIWLAAKNAPPRDLARIALYDALAVAYGLARSGAGLRGRAQGLRRWREFRAAYAPGGYAPRGVEGWPNPFAVRGRYAHLRGKET